MSIGAVSTAAIYELWDAAIVAGGLCITDDGGVFVDETIPFNEATADDVEVLPAVPANGDATYLGHGAKFGRVDVEITTPGVGTWTIDWEYCNGAWVALPGVIDETLGWAETAGTQTIAFQVPTDWIPTTIAGVTAYWIRGVVSGFVAVVTPPRVGQGWIIGPAFFKLKSNHSGRGTDTRIDVNPDECIFRVAPYFKLKSGAADLFLYG
jgi:hypothetical protein